MAGEWTGPIDKCDVCRERIADRFVDGATRSGPWAIMCPSCFLRVGMGLGVGRGQSYVRSGDRFVRDEPTRSDSQRWAFDRRLDRMIDEEKS